MVIIGYDAMLRHGQDTTGTPGCGCVGSAPLQGRAAVCPRGRAGCGHARAGGESADRARLVSPVAPRGPAGIESGGPAGPEAAARPTAAGPGGDGPAPGAAAARLRHRPLDAAARGAGHRPIDGGSLSSGPRLVPLARAAVVAATARAARARAGRGGDSAVGPAPLARGKKNARRQRAWLVFEDESGVSQQPVVRRTWAPRGQTPVLTATGANWQRLSVAGALAFRWDARRTRFYFQTRPGSYTDVALIAFVRQLQRHFRGQRALLLLGGRAAHRSRTMRAYLGRQRAWLTVERLPGYAPELNPIEQVWGNVKGGALANVCADDLAAAPLAGRRHPAPRAFARIRPQPHLAFAFLRHAGLTLYDDHHPI